MTKNKSKILYTAYLTPDFITDHVLFYCVGKLGKNFFLPSENSEKLADIGTLSASMPSDLHKCPPEAPCRLYARFHPEMCLTSLSASQTPTNAKQAPPKGHPPHSEHIFHISVGAYRAFV